MINYAVVGAGWISQQAFLPGVVQSGNSRVAAIVTGDRAKAARLVDFYGIGAIVGYDGYDKADLRALVAIEKAAATGIPQAISAQPRSRHPTPDMVRLTPITDRRLVL